MVDIHSKRYLNSAENDAVLEEEASETALEEDQALIAMKEKLPGYICCR